MAIEPKDEYGGQTLTSDAGYPFGKARNQIVEGDGVGTPFEEKWLNDLWGFLQSLLVEASITPSGDPDEVGASQYMEAFHLLRRLTPTGLEVRRPLSLDSATPQNAASIAKWERVVDSGAYVWRSRAAGLAPLLIPLNSYVADDVDAGDLVTPLRGVEITGVSVSMEPGTSRTGNDRMQVQLVQAKLVGGVLTETVVASEYGTTGTGLDTVSITGLTHAFDPFGDYTLRVFSGDDGDANQDRVYAASITFKSTKLPL